MKHIIVKMFVLCTMLLCSCSYAFSENDPPEGLVIENGWMTGTVTAHFNVDTEYETTDVLKVDCPEPTASYPSQILTVVNGYVSKKQMQIALKAAGQSTQGKFVNNRGSASYTGDWNAEASADITKEEAAAQAIEIGQKYFNALGVEVDPVPKTISRPYDYDAWMEIQQRVYEHRFSDTSTFIENAKAHWKRTSKYHPKQSEYTTVTFCIMLDGMRLDMNPSYPAGYADEPDAWEGFFVSAEATVSDSGILVEASCTLLEVLGRRPLKDDPVYESFLTQFHARPQPLIAARNWQEALTAAITDAQPAGLLTRNSEDRLYKNQYMDDQITAYGSRTVITEISPILHTISRSEWAPFWSIETMQEYSDGWRY